jgi:hypothetical protein
MRTLRPANVARNSRRHDGRPTPPSKQCVVVLLGALESASLEALVESRSPSVARVVRLLVRSLDWLVDGLVV